MVGWHATPFGAVDSVPRDNNIFSSISLTPSLLDQRLAHASDPTAASDDESQ
jgi:hypothetical protein